MQLRSDATLVRAWPVVDWRTIVQAFQPAHEATEARLRTLRAREAISHGFRNPLREQHQLAGSATLYCELNVDAAVLSRRGDTGAAMAYREKARGVEEQLPSLLETHQVDGSLLEPRGGLRPGAREVLRCLSDAVSKARMDLPSVPDEDTVPGVLESSSGSWVHFRSTEASTIGFELPWLMVSRAGLSVGDPAVVCRELLPSGSAILRLQPGLFMEAEPTDLAVEEATVHDGRLGRPLGSQVFRKALFAELNEEAPKGRRILG
jgi:hypothetical protein